MQSKNSLFQNKEYHKNYELHCLSHSVTPEWIEMRPRGEPQLQTFRYKKVPRLPFLAGADKSKGSNFMDFLINIKVFVCGSARNSTIHIKVSGI